VEQLRGSHTPVCGEIPVAGAVMDKTGNLYGTTGQGDHSFGTVLKLKR
jgi:hypothetical protein